jgi:hypothetical protein
VAHPAAPLNEASLLRPTFKTSAPVRGLCLCRQRTHDVAVFVHATTSLSNWRREVLRVPSATGASTTLPPALYHRVGASIDVSDAFPRVRGRRRTVRPSRIRRSESWPDNPVHLGVTTNTIVLNWITDHQVVYPRRTQMKVTSGGPTRSQSPCSEHSTPVAVVDRELDRLTRAR